MSKILTPAHHEVMRAFLSLLEGETDEDCFHLTTFHEESRLVQQFPSEVGSVEKLDPAIAGLVDKVVLSSAELFYAGLPVSEDSSFGCAKHSEFTTQVVSGRKAVLAKAASGDEVTRLWNDVRYISIAAREADH